MISASKATEAFPRMRNERNRILKKMTLSVTSKTEEIGKLVDGIDNVKEEAKMFKAVKLLHRKEFENPFVHYEEGTQTTNPKEIYETVRKHFQNHFHDNIAQTIPWFTGHPRPLKKRITIEEVTSAFGNSIITEQQDLMAYRTAELDGKTLTEIMILTS